jgi:hypothetical protein
MVLTVRGGWFRFSGIPDAGAVELRSASGVARIGSPDIEGDLEPLSLRGLVTPVTGIPRTPVSGVFGARIRGEIRTESGEPISGAQVRGVGCSNGRRVVVTTYTDSTGVYSFDNLPVSDRYRVIATCPGFQRLRSPVMFIAGPQDVRVVALVLRAR